MRTRLLWLAVACLGVALVALIMISRPSRSGSSGIAEATPRQVQATEPVQAPAAFERSEPGREAAASTPATDKAPAAAGSPGILADSSVGGTAAAFYGQDWEKIRPELAKRIDLSMMPDIPLPPWESVLDSLKDAMRVSDARFATWLSMYGPPNPITLEHLAERYTVSDDVTLDSRDIAAIEAALVEPRMQLRDRLQQLRRACDETLQEKFHAGQYNYGPFASIRTDKLPKAAFYADGVAIRGWSISWALARDEHPEFVMLLAELDASKKQMRASIQAYLDKLK